MSAAGPSHWRLGAMEARLLLQRREVSPLELVDAAIHRIEAVDGPWTPGRLPEWRPEPID